MKMRTKTTKRRKKKMKTKKVMKRTDHQVKENTVKEIALKKKMIR